MLCMLLLIAPWVKPQSRHCARKRSFRSATSLSERRASAPVQALKQCDRNQGGRRTPLGGLKKPIRKGYNSVSRDGSSRKAL
jgi:hypothetical protein